MWLVVVIIFVLSYSLSIFGETIPVYIKQYDFNLRGRKESGKSILES